MRYFSGFIFVSLVYFGFTGQAQAYIDPGILAIAYQAIYALLFGAMAVFILRPWNWMKGFLSRFRQKRSSPADGAGETNAEDDGR